MRAQNKASLATEADKVGLASPQGEVCGSAEEALAAARGFGFPVLVKPVQGVVEVDDRLARYPSRLAQDERAVAEAQQHIGTCIVQRRQVGNVVSFAGVFTDQGLLGSGGGTVSADVASDRGDGQLLGDDRSPGKLSEQVGALVEAIGWRGLSGSVMSVNGSVQALRTSTPPVRVDEHRPAAGTPLVATWCRLAAGAGAPARRTGAGRRPYRSAQRISQ